MSGGIIRLNVVCTSKNICKIHDADHYESIQAFSIKLLQVYYTFTWEYKNPDRTWNVFPCSISKHNWTRSSAG